MNNWTSGYYVNRCGCPHIGSIPSWDRHSYVSSKLLNFLHKLLHKNKTKQQMIDETVDDIWDSH